MSVARRMWHQLEAVHALFWYAPETSAAAAALGYKTDTMWPHYFAWRAAPLGAAGVERVASAFYVFSPRLVAEHIPAAWAIASPDHVLDARLRAVDDVYRPLLEGDPTEAAALAREAAGAADLAGRALSAANAELPWPDEPHLALWHALGILREHRGDGHFAALLAAGLDPVEALVSFTAIDAASRKTLSTRGWTDEEWDAARERLVSRGLLNPDGTATDACRDLRDSVERVTDDLARRPWEALGEVKAERLAELIRPLLVRVLKTGHLPTENALGIGKVQAPPR
ncbi:SCO6745 family protein [Spirillospora albida]|uniref:SCO6745 family protein n=1 Tax=Spirillospora albida TaxID=58123 RepID=UPI0004C0856C|nr:hypothetical protein [Spirillospora albida]